MTKQLTGADFQTYLAENEVVLVDFTATWCPPCQMIKPVVNQVAEEYSGRAGVAMVDVDQSPELAQQFGVSGIPNLIFFKNGQPADQIVGAVPKPALTQKLDALIGSAAGA